MSAADDFHRPVLLAQCLELLDAAPGRLVVDATLGDGGHAEAILERTAPGRPPDRRSTATRTRSRIAGAPPRAASARACTSCTPRSASSARVLARLAIGGVDGVLLDLGVSSRQLDAPARGFRFAEASAAETPLDMRMDPSAGETAAELLARASEAELEAWFREYGELPGARRLARTLVQTRRRAAAPHHGRPAAPRSREARVGARPPAPSRDARVPGAPHRVNDELGALDEGLEAALCALAPGRPPRRDRLPLARGPRS